MIEKRSHKISVKTSRLRKRDAIVVELVEVGQFSNGVFFQCIGGGRSKRWSPLLLMAALQLQQMNFQTNLLHPKRKTGPPLGFKNLGNTCYLNSVLQCLTYTPPLANFCLKSQHSSLCDSASDADRKRNCPFCILERRIARSLSSDLALDAPHKIQSCLRLFADHFRCGRQEDAHEFLRYVIDACHNACLRLKKLRRKESEPFNGSDTVVKEIFGGALQSQVKCLSCGSESNKVDEIMDLSLDVLHSNSVREAMVKFFQPEILDGNNKYKCENCKKLVAARKQMSILQAPNILVIQLKRFEGIFGGKIDKVIPFEEVLVLSNFMNKTSQDLHPEYSLFGSIVHSGYSPESGHYYAYIKDAMGRWYCCNDSYVTLSTLQEVLSEKVYILFFSRAKQRPGPASTDFTANGVKSRNYNCNNATNKNATNSPKAAQKAVHPKTQIEHFSGKNTSTIPKNGRVSSSLQMKFNLGNSGSKRVSATENGNFNVHKSQSSKKNGDVKDIENKENNMVSSINMNGENGMPSLVNGNGVYKNKKVDPVDSKRRQALALPPENGKVQSTGVDSKRADTSENNGTRSKVTTGKEHGSHELYNGRVNGHSDNLGSKRKSHEVDSCILFAKDAQSQVEINEFKEVLMKEASLVLRSCGWSDEVYSFMHSQKRLCSSEADSSPSSGNALKKKLIADAKPSYIPQIPESLKENFIERLKLLSKKKPILGP